MSGVSRTRPMYPFASLPENLTAFCAVLRRDYAFRIGPRELQDAARALQIASIGDERAVRDILRPVLSRTFDQVQVFDRAFRAFFHPAALAREDLRLADPRGREEGMPSGAERAVPVGPKRLSSDPTDGRAIVDGAALNLADAGTDDAAGLLRSSFSPVEAEGTPPDFLPVDNPWRESAAVFVRCVQTTLSRRWKPAVHGRRFDLRRTLRSSLHTGGEPVLPRWRARPRLHPRFLVLVDGSRSMASHAGAALRIAVALATVAARVEVFVFSTELRRVTRDVHRAAAGERRRLSGLHHAWGGGTGIGSCLRDLIHRFGERALGRHTVAIVASDGLDAGDPQALRQVMADLHRRSAAVVWLNPLLDTPGYEPSALGMRAARPFVSTFAWAGDAAGLLRLARLVRVRS